jgi:hypothetical protein
MDAVYTNLVPPRLWARGKWLRHPPFPAENLPLW